MLHVFGIEDVATGQQGRGDDHCIVDVKPMMGGKFDTHFVRVDVDWTNVEQAAEQQQRFFDYRPVQ